MVTAWFVKLADMYPSEGRLLYLSQMITHGLKDRTNALLISCPSLNICGKNNPFPFADTNDYHPVHPSIRRQKSHSISQVLDITSTTTVDPLFVQVLLLQLCNSGTQPPTFFLFGPVPLSLSILAFLLALSVGLLSL